MFSITIRERSGQVYTFHFDKHEVQIGRVKGNDVILPKQNISKRHALVRANGGRFVIEDLGSTNGTYVNGNRISTAVEIGAVDLEVALDAKPREMIDLPRRLNRPAGVAEQSAPGHRPVTGPATDDPVVLVGRHEAG